MTDLNDDAAHRNHGLNKISLEENGHISASFLKANNLRCNHMI
jgi:hypothetical protein